MRLGMLPLWILIVPDCSKQIDPQFLNRAKTKPTITIQLISKRHFKFCYHKISFSLSATSSPFLRTQLSFFPNMKNWIQFELTGDQRVCFHIAKDCMMCVRHGIFRLSMITSHLL